MIYFSTATIIFKKSYRHTETTEVTFSLFFWLFSINELKPSVLDHQYLRELLLEGMKNYVFKQEFL